MLTKTELTVLRNLHLTGMTGKACGFLTQAQRMAILKSLIEKGMLDKNGNVTAKGIEASVPRYNPSLQTRYEDFHGHKPRTRKQWNFHVPSGFVILGKAVAIEYQTDKLNGGGDGKKAVYRHKFDTPCLLLMDERAKKQLYIVGEKMIVTDRGIEN